MIKLTIKLQTVTMVGLLQKSLVEVARKVVNGELFGMFKTFKQDVMLD